MSQLSQRSIEDCLFVHSAIDDAGFTANQLRVLIHIRRRMNKETGWATAGVKSMAKTCLLHHDTVRACLQELLRRQALEMEEDEGIERRYRVTPPDQWKTPPKVMEGSAPRKRGRPPRLTPPKQMEGFMENPSETNGGDPSICFGKTPPKQMEPKVILKGNPLKVPPPASPPVPGDKPKAKKRKEEKAESPDPRFKAVTDGYCAAYLAVVGSPYAHNRGRDGQRLKLLLKSLNPEQFPAEKIVGFATAALESTGAPFARDVKAARTLYGFCDRFNDIRAELKVLRVNGAGDKTNSHNGATSGPPPWTEVYAWLAAQRQYTDYGKLTEWTTWDRLPRFARDKFYQDRKAAKIAS